MQEYKKEVSNYNLWFIEIIAMMLIQFWNIQHGLNNLKNWEYLWKKLKFQEDWDLKPLKWDSGMQIKKFNKRKTKSHKSYSLAMLQLTLPNKLLLIEILTLVDLIGINLNLELQLIQEHNYNKSKHKKFQFMHFMLLIMQKLTLNSLPKKLEDNVRH